MQRLEVEHSLRELEAARAREQAATAQVEELTRRLETEPLVLRTLLTEVRERLERTEQSLEQSRVETREVDVRYRLLKERVLRKYREIRPGQIRVPDDSVFRSLDDLISLSGLPFPRDVQPEGSAASRPPRPARRPRDDEGESSQRATRPREGEGEGGGESEHERDQGPVPDP
jgi:hypothetical protein